MVDISRPPAGFEQTYLELNSDVYEAVQKGEFSSGWEHYIVFGSREHRPGVPAEAHRAVHNIWGDDYTILPTPPAALRKRVHGTDDLPSFEGAGKMISLNLHSSIVSAIELGKHSRVLDFGCGCGRVIRYFHKLHNNCSFYGTDIDSEAISWCQKHLSTIGNFLTNEPWPSLPFSDGTFDFIYSLSVFTHLPEDMQFAWLEELGRVTKNGGYLILTTHGEELLQAPSTEIAKQLQQKGFYYSVDSGTEGLPGFYQTSFHTEEYIRNRWSSFLEIERIIKKGVDKHQDLILCKKPGKRTVQQDSPAGADEARR